MEVRPNVEEPLDEAGVLGDAAHVEHVLPVVFLAQVDVVQQLREPFQHPSQYTRLQQPIFIIGF